MAPSASSNSIFITTSSLCSYRLHRVKWLLIWETDDVGNSGEKHRRTLIFLPLLPSPFLISAFLLASAFIVLVTRGITRRPCGVGRVSCFTFNILPFPAPFLTGMAAFSFSFASILWKRATMSQKAQDFECWMYKKPGLMTKHLFYTSSSSEKAARSAFQRSDGLFFFRVFSSVSCQVTGGLILRFASGFVISILKRRIKHTLASLCLHNSSFFSLVRNHMGMLSR